MKENHVVSNSSINSAHIASFMSSNSKIAKVDFGHSQSRFIPVWGGGKRPYAALPKDDVVKRPPFQSEWKLDKKINYGYVDYEVRLKIG